MRNWATTEVKCATLVIADDFHASWILETYAVANRRGECCNVGLRVGFEQAGNFVDRFSGDLGFIALYVNEQVDVGHLLGDCRNAICTALKTGVSQNTATAETFDGLLEFFTVNRDHDSIWSFGERRGLESMLKYGLSRFTQQKLFRQSSRC